MTWRFSQATDIGGRDEQQDRVAILESAAGEAHLIVVADGMGGHDSGAAAAQLVVDTARSRFNCQTPIDPEEFLTELCQEAHRAIQGLAINSSRSPGSTCVMLYLKGEEAYWAHVGDSRLYLLRHGKVCLQTTDHSVVQLLVAQGRTESMKLNPNIQNQIYMRLGGDKAPQPELDGVAVNPGDMFLVCSDGFWQSVDADEIAGTVNALELEEDSATRLVALARERGGPQGDNIGLALASWVAPSPESKAGFRRRLGAFLGGSR